MRFFVLTLFPEMITEGLSYSIIGRAEEHGLVSVVPVNIRDYADNSYGQVDDYPYGGGAGMLMQPGPVYRACKDVQSRCKKSARVIYMTPSGRPFTQKIAQELAKEEDLIFLCGHYEGIDERALHLCVTDSLSAGDYVLTGGELPAMMMIDCISRLIPGVLSNENSAEEESFSDGLLEYPQYTRPEEFMGEKVPDVLLSGHHARIAAWRREQALLRTAALRPDLLQDADLSGKDREFLQEQRQKEKNE